MNVWNFTGNLGRDAVLKYSPSGTAVSEFSVAVKSGYGEREQTTWARCALFGKQAEAVNDYLVKGQQVGISGELTAREWTDKEGQKRTSIEVRVNDLTLLGRRDDGQREAAPQRQAPQQRPPQTRQSMAQQAPAGGLADMDDSIPF